MANFTTRVELHQANSQDYDMLHAAMQREGFSRNISSTDGRWYQLPTAEYDCGGTFTIEHVQNCALAAAKSTGKAHGVFVTETTTKRLFTGLIEIRKS
jgi:hypothetical protein